VRRTATDTDTLIEEVARGERLLEEIGDARLRETVRLALRLHKDPFTAPDAGARARIRSQVMRSLRPHPATIADRVALAFEILAKPAPYAARALALAAIGFCIAASTTVASAESLPADAVYGVKLASEQMRLALAATPEDRAGVQLSIAEHRLAEAALLAALGDDDGAIVVTSAYGAHVANAAAELAQVETGEPGPAALVAQLERRIDEHRAIAAAAARRLSDDPTRAAAAAYLAMLANGAAPASDLSPAAAIAARAADAADEIATAAERRLTSALRTNLAELTAPHRFDLVAAIQSRVEWGLGSQDRAELESLSVQADPIERARSSERAAQTARKAADEAKAAAMRAREGSTRHTSTPRQR
jgi:uncharacterized protein DUF5667